MGYVGVVDLYQGVGGRTGGGYCLIIVFFPCAFVLLCLLSLFVK